MNLIILIRDNPKIQYIKYIYQCVLYSAQNCIKDHLRGCLNSRVVFIKIKKPIPRSLCSAAETIVWLLDSMGLSSDNIYVN